MIRLAVDNSAMRVQDCYCRCENGDWILLLKPPQCITLRLCLVRYANVAECMKRFKWSPPLPHV